MSNPHYLSHLARLGAPDLHPSGARGTARLEAALATRPGDRVLDLGCGTGQTMVRLAAGHALRLDGVDRLEEMLAVARLRLALAGLRSRTSLVRADGAVGLPFADRRYDRVYAESVLGFQTAQDARRILGEVWRVLRPGGRFLANEAVWKTGTSRATVSAIHEASVADFGLAQASAEGWSLAEWLGCLRDAGFIVVSSEPLHRDARARGAVPRRSVRSTLTRLPALTLSAALTMILRARGRLSPSIRHEARDFRRRLARHREDGRYIEAHLFVLEKPGA